MKKYLFPFALALMIFLPSKVAASDFISYTTSASFGILHGNIIEEVYTDKCQNTDNLLSKLDWELTAIPYFQVNAGIDIIKYIHLDVTGRIGIPVESGHMQDYDWQNSTTPAWKNDSPTELTNYSKHTNQNTEYKLMGVTIGGNIPLPARFTLTPFINYEYELISFDGWDGYKIYKSDSWEKIPFSGKVITYKQETNALFIGVTVTSQTLDRFTFSGTVKISPGLTSILALDYHYVRPYAPNNVTLAPGTLFRDDIKNAFQLKAEIKALYNFNKHHHLGLVFGLQWLQDTKGPDYITGITTSGKRNGTGWIKSIEQGGTSRFLMNWELTYSFVF